MISSLQAYLPIDRCLALVRGEQLPNRAVGVVMLADISGFSQLMQLLTEEHGRRQGVELLIEMINPVYEMLIDTLHRYRGSVIGFAGDSITCWLDGQDGNAEARGVACALKMQKGMASFQDMVLPGGTAVSLSVKIALAAGPVRRFLVGNPEIHLQDVLAGETLERMAMAEQIAAANELLVDNHIATALGDKIEVAEWRESFGIVSAIKQTVNELPWPQLPRVGADLRPFVSRIVRIRLQADESFLGDLRVVSPLFLKFSGIDYDSDEAAAEQLDAFIRWVQGIVTQYGGMLHELTIGDKGSYLYINFGALQAHEDDGKRAVAAAYDLCQIPAELNFIDGVQIGVTRGVAYTGVCGTAERRAFVVMGPAVNEAARIMQMVSIGTVGCNIAAYEAAKSAYDFVSLSPVRTKSRKKWIPVFQPVAQKQGQTMIGEAQFMVGRAFAVEKLNSFLAQIASSQPHLLFIEGEAGIGKSMLVSTLVALLKEQGWVYLVGAGQSIGRQTPYLAWQDVFNHYFGLFGISDNELRQQRVQTRFVQMLPEEVIWLPLLNDILNLGLAETNETASLPVEVRQQKLSDLLVGLLRQWSLNEPLIIVLEDVHWLDLLSWELTMQVTHHFLDEALPFGLCAVTRPIDEKELGYRYWQQLRGDDTLKTIIPLTPLEHQTIAQLMAQKLDVLVKDVPSQLVSLVQTRAEGNPLFTEELVFALLEQRVVRVENGRCHIRGDLAQIQQTLPDSLHSLILSRLDRLSLEQQFILKVASVIGRAFAFAPLNALLNEYQAIDEDKLQEILHALETANFAYVEKLEPQLIYHFKHIITQEATYQTLHFQQRRQLHASAARWYEGQLDNLGGEIYVPLLVHHYHHAKEPTKEGKYAQLAGEQSASRFANQDAISYFTRALALVSPDDLESIYELYKRREMVYSLLGQRQEQREDLSVLMDLAKEWGDVERITAVYLRQAHYFEAITEYEQALSCVQKVITSAEHVQDKELAAEGYLLHGQIQWQMKEYVDARTTLEKAVTLADEVQNVKLRSDAIRFIGATYMYRRNIPTAQLYFQQSLALCRELDDKIGQGQALNNLGFAARNQGFYDEAIRLLVEALQLFRQTGERRMQGYVLHNLGECFRQVGEYQKGHEYAQAALRIRRQIQSLRGQISTLATLSGISFGLGLEEEAVAYAYEALDIAQRAEIDALIGVSSVIISEALLLVGRLNEALLYIQQHVAHSEKFGTAVQVAESRVMLGQFYLEQGDLETAVTHITPACSLLADGNVDSFLYPMNTFLVCIKILQALRDPQAVVLLQKSHELIQTRAALIRDNHLRQSYLQNVVVHREIIALYERNNQPV